MPCLLFLLGLVALASCRPAATESDILRAQERRLARAHIARLEAARERLGAAFSPDSLALLGAAYMPGYPGTEPDTARGMALLREALARGSREAPFHLAFQTSDSLQRRALFRLALRRGNAEAVEWLSAPFLAAGRYRADSLVMLIREARRYAGAGAARRLERDFIVLDSLANQGDRAADSTRADLRRHGLWEERFSASNSMSAQHTSAL